MADLYKVRITDLVGKVHEDETPAGPLEIVKNFVFMTVVGLVANTMSLLVDSGDHDPMTHRKIRREMTREISRLDFADGGFFINVGGVKIEVYKVEEKFDF